MNRPTYEFEQQANPNVYTFTSVGVNGEIKKAVIISRIESISDDPNAQFYNLAFGDLADATDYSTCNDDVRSNNGDMPKILATVVKVTMEFLTKNRTATLMFSGLIDEKSRLLGRNQRNILYHRAIDSNWFELSLLLEVYGINGMDVEEYRPGVQYETVLLRRK
ncbi:DUF6934 family protein [Dyadobacter luticola]|uniref:Uncharacterized protein n=1 Tax=Dyadobacter luticola TaxID=1979387 RepID=A0A5R9KSZ6_9BACT|nr:hypothetical protein [Dyadobacter luticola]TLU99391.1 hypothetical protein FEN17_22780 [Dyadobacter luticola]